MAADSEPPASPESTLRQRRPTSAEKEKAALDTQVASAAAGDVGSAVALRYVQQAAPALAYAGELISKVGPYYVRAAALGATVYETLPLDIVQALLGLALCFFGGAYYASIAAVEAFMMVGWATTRAALEDIYEDLLLIHEASERDDKQQAEILLQADKLDKTRLARSSSGAELVQRKMRVAVLAVRDPEKLSQAVGGLYAGWIAVQGTLRLEFAKTITLGVSIAAMLDKPALRCAALFAPTAAASTRPAQPTCGPPLAVSHRYGLPILTHAVPAEYHRWLPTAIRTLCKAVAVSIAWWLAVAIAAFQSALRGE